MQSKGTTGLKEKILVKAEALFMRYGIKSVTMDDIARDLGMSKRTLYQYVDNKSDLLNQIIQQFAIKEQATIEALSNDASNAMEEMINIAKHVTQTLREVPSSTLYDLQKYYRDAWILMQSITQEHIHGVIKSNLEKGIEEGLYRSNLNVDIIAKLYVGKTNLIVDEDMFPLKNYNKEQLFLEYVRYHIHGIASTKGLELFGKYTNTPS